MAVALVLELVERCGAVPREMSAAQHDEAVGRGSHLPQVAASALAAALLHSGAPVLSGPGLVDTTRLAASPTELWVDILTRNAGVVGPAVRELAAHLDAVADDLAVLAQAGDAVDQRHLRARASTGLRDFLVQGRRGRELVPLKKGEGPTAFAKVLVVLRDEPGQLAAVLRAAAESGANVEDLRVEHLTGRGAGLLELDVREQDRAGLVDALRTAGWAVE